jgi:hypothetical protein
MNVQQTSEPQLLITSRDAARRLCICERTLHNLSQPRGDLPVVRLPGRMVRYDVAALQRWIADKSQNTTNSPKSNGEQQ